MSITVVCPGDGFDRYNVFPNATQATSQGDDSGLLHIYEAARRVATFRVWEHWYETGAK